MRIFVVVAKCQTQGILSVKQRLEWAQDKFPWSFSHAFKD